MTNTTLAELARDALQVQDASNLSGVVSSFARTMARLRELNPGQPTTYYNTHPICVLFASKVASLTGCESALSFSAAYDDCERLRTTATAEVSK